MDLIERQAAIDALAKFVPYAICDESTESYTNGLTDAYNLILQLPSAEPDSDQYEQGIIEGRVQMRTELLTKLKEMVGEEIWTNI